MNKSESFVIITLAVCSGILLAALVVLIGYGVFQGIENRAEADRAVKQIQRQTERAKQATPKPTPTTPPTTMTEAELQNALEELHKKLKEGK